MKIFALILLVAVMTLAGSLGSYYLKLASGEQKINAMLTKPQLYIGGGLYAVGCLLNVLLLRYVDYSVALPLTSLTYVWTLIISHLRLGEALTARKLIGVALIFIGAVFVAL